MPELDDERYVRELFEQLYTLQLVKIPETQEKTFDSELRMGGAAVAAVEVKRFGSVPRTGENGWVSGSGGGMTRPDNAAKRVGAAIYDAYKQLAPTRQPRILVFVNDETLMDFLDFREATEGFLVYGEGDQRFKNTAGTKIAEGRIREMKLCIDLYIWINRYEGRTLCRADGKPLEPHAERGPFFVCTSDVGHDLATRYFGLRAIPKPEAPADADVPTFAELLRRQTIKR